MAQYNSYSVRLATVLLLLLPFSLDEWLIALSITVTLTISEHYFRG